jgi:hypothetical protein
MTQLDIDRLSDQELTELTARLCRQVMARQRVAMPLAIPGEDQKPIGFLVPVPSKELDDIDPNFLAEAKCRLDNPPDRYLSVDEFLDALDDYWSKADAAGRQPDSANAHNGRVGGLRDPVHNPPIAIDPGV